MSNDYQTHDLPGTADQGWETDLYIGTNAAACGARPLCPRGHHSSPNPTPLYPRAHDTVLRDVSSLSAPHGLLALFNEQREALIVPTRSQQARISLQVGGLPGLDTLPTRGKPTPRPIPSLPLENALIPSYGGITYILHIRDARPVCVVYRDIAMECL